MKKSKLSTILILIFLGVLVLYLVPSIVPVLFKSEEITVQPAESIVYDDVIQVTGIALRDEVLVGVSGAPSSVDYRVSDGNRVSIGDPVATYSTATVSASDRLNVEAIDRKISLLTKCVSSTTQYDVKTLDAQTKSAINDYLSVLESGNLSNTMESSEEVYSYFIKRDIKASGDKSYYQQLLVNCESTRKTLLSGSNASQTAVYASQAGYFSSQFDGYEEYSMTKYKESSPEGVKNLLSQTPKDRSSGYIGKLQHFSDWIFLCNVPAETAKLLKVGTNWTIRFDSPAYGLQTVTMQVSRLSEEVDGEVAVSFACSFFNKALYSLRICNAQIVMDSFSGFKVDNDAIRISDGKTGVYVLSGAKLVFKPVKVLYRSEERDFSVIEPEEKVSLGRKLMLNDSVVIGGKDVYDGKVININ